MGLLDELLGGLAGQSTGGGRMQQQPPTQAGGGGMSQVLIALMPIVLGMLANRGARGGAPTQANYAPQGGGGGLGDLLGQVLGGAGGGGGGRGGGGGLGGLLTHLQQAGFGEQADSWVSRGTNKPISPDAMSEVFGRDGLEQISRRAGVSQDEAARGLSQLLPEVVDHMTPNGDMPDDDALASSVDDFAKRLGLS
jgi:uncharacterized protein YidB (DUF937 family)